MNVALSNIKFEMMYNSIFNGKKINEPPRGKNNNVVSEQV